MAAYWPSSRDHIAAFMNGVEKYVFSRTLRSADWNNTTLVSGDAADEVRRLKEREGGAIFIFGSADFASTLIAQDSSMNTVSASIRCCSARARPSFRTFQSGRSLISLMSAPLKSGVVIPHYRPESA